MRIPFLASAVAWLGVTATLHLIAHFFYLYSAYPRLDMVVHTLGGLWVALFAVAILLFSSWALPVAVSPRSVTAVSIGAAIAAGVVWELLEYVSGSINAAAPLVNTVTDLVMGVVGAIIAALYVVMARYEH